MSIPLFGEFFCHPSPTPANSVSKNQKFDYLPVPYQRLAYPPSENDITVEGPLECKPSVCLLLFVAFRSQTSYGATS